MSASINMPSPQLADAEVVFVRAGSCSPWELAISNTCPMSSDSMRARPSVIAAHIVIWSGFGIQILQS